MKLVGRRPEPNVLFLTWQLAGAVGSGLDDVLRPTGLTAGEFGLYSLLRFSPGLSVSELADHAGMPVTTVSRRLKALLDAGHLQRTADGDDGRVQRHRLTEAGEAAHERGARVFARLLEQVEDRLGSDVELVEAALHTLRRAMTGPDVVGRTSDRGVRGEGSAHAVHYGGQALSDSQQDEVRAYVEWIRHRDSGRRADAS